MAYDEDLADRIREQIGGRSMAGWLRVDADYVRTTRQLQRWVGIGSATARALSPKR